MITKLKNVYALLKENVFERYPVTLVAVWLGTILGAIVFDHSSESWEWAYRLLYMVLTFALGSLLAEEWFYESSTKRMVGCILSAALSIFFVNFLYIDEAILKRAGIEGLYDFVAKLFIAYLVWLPVLCLYHMYKRSEKSFSEYCMIAFGSLMKTTLVHGLFALGVLIIMLIVDALLFSVNDSIIRLEILLAGWVYVPGLVLAISDTEKKVSKFYQLVIKFVLMPLLIAAFAIIYLYIVKLVVSLDLPDNEVFSILSFLFGVGIPIWTMGSVFSDTKMGKVANLLPYVFIPFIFLQMLCIGLRVHQYGITFERCAGLYLIVFEICYLILFSIFQKKYVSWSFVVIAALVTCFLLMPGLCFEDMTYLSHKSVLDKMLALSEANRQELSVHEKSRLLGAFDEIQSTAKGKKVVAAISDKDREWISELAEEITGFRPVEHKNIYADARMDKIPVDGYQYVSSFSVRYGEHADKDMAHLVVEYGRNESFEQDFSDYLKEMEDFYDEQQENDGVSRMDEWLRQNQAIQAVTGGKLLVESVGLEFQKGKPTYIYISGHYLE